MVLDMQRDALLAAGINIEHLYEDMVSGSLDARPGLTICMKALRDGDTLVVWKLDRLAGDLCRELGITRQTLYRHVWPDGSLRKASCGFPIRSLDLMT